MSLKDLFGKTSEKIVNSKILQELYKEAESKEFVEEIVEDKERFLPKVDFSNPANFARYGSAEKYYVDSMTNIYQNYPYDGSKKEKQEWRNNSTQLDLYIFDNIYPKTTGYVNLGSGTVGTYTTSSVSYRFSSYPQYVTVKGGPNPSLTGQFETSNIYDVTKNRESNLGISEHGNTVEFWFKDNVSTGSAAFNQVFALFDTWNGVASGSNNYSRLLLEHSSSNIFLLTYASGTNGIERYPISYTQDRTNWHHYAFTFKNNLTNINNLDICLYIDGKLLINETIVGAGGFSLADNAGMIANIGAYRADINGTNTNFWDGFGNAFGSFDEFRFWKTARTSKQIYRYWFTNVGGGTNTDDANTDLGVYFKFNEGIVNTNEISALDTLVIDYSGRVSNGSIVNYSLNCRITSSAIDLYFNDPLTPESSEYEIIEQKDPILYSSNPLVDYVINQYKITGSEYDRTNNANIYYSVPSWITEEAEYNETNDLSNLIQIISSHFDTLHLQIKDLSSLRNVQYVSDGEKPKPFSNKLLSSYGFENIDLFNDVTFLEDLLSRNENMEFDEKLHNIKNVIYQNIFNNLSYIYKSKGTEKSLRNLLRCFGVDEELVKVNLYSDNSQYELTTKYKSVSSPKKFVDFNDADRYNGYIYQKNISGDTDTRSYILGNGENKLDYVPLTAQLEVIFPKKVRYDEPQYDVPDFTEVSIFGAHTAKGNEENLTWGDELNNDYFNFQVYAVKRNYESPDVYFKLVTTIAGVTSSLTTSFYNDVYDNQKWNFAVRVSPKKLDFSNTTSGSDIGGYQLEFIGNNSVLDNLENNFNISLDIPEVNAKAALNSNKRFYVGAHYTDFNDSYILTRTDIKASSLRVWLDYLTDEELLHHSYDSTNIGRQYPNWKPYYEITSEVAFTKLDTLALNWDFFNVTTTDNNGEFIVQDASSGSLIGSTISAYPLVGNVTKIRHTGYAKEFFPNDEQVVNKEYVFNAKQVTPESIAGSDLIQVPITDDLTRTKTSKPINFYISIEKSMSQVINDEILNWFATIKDFNNLIGDPTEKYREEYKGLTHLRTLFFEKVQNTPDFEKFLEFYKWIDNSISSMMTQLIPASANISNKVRNMVESHLLERNKYQNIAPTVSFNDDIVISLGSVLDYSYDQQKSNASSAGTLWLKQRAERINDPVNTPLEPNNDIDREIVRQVANNKNLNKIPVFYSTDTSTNYEGYKDRIRFFGNIYRFKAENLVIVEDTINPTSIANQQFIGQFQFAEQTVTASGQIVQPIKKKPNFSNKYEYLQLSSRATNNKSFVDLTGSTIILDTPSIKEKTTIWNEKKFLTGSQAGILDYFGYSVAINSIGDVLVVGAYSDESVPPPGPPINTGLAYIFRSSSAGWNEEKVLTGSFATQLNDRFGDSVVINSSGDTIAISAWQDEVSSLTTSIGLVYVYKSSSAGWNEEKVLTGSYANNSSDFFGRSISMNSSGDVIAVGATGDEISVSNSGLAYIFRSSSAGWNEEKVLTGSVTTTNDSFGYSISINSNANILLVGSLLDEVSYSDSGIVYVFRSSSIGWNQEKILTGSFSTNSNDNFGYSLAINSSGNLAIVGSPQDETGSTTSVGITYIFRSSSAGWNEEKVLTGSFANNTNDQFGNSVAVNSIGDRIVVGAWLDETGSTTGVGLTYIFNSSSTGWNEEKVLTGSYANNTSDNFGTSITINSLGDVIAVGAQSDELPSLSDTGLAYIYKNAYNYYYTERTLPTRNTYKNIFVERFSAPGGPETLSRGALDNASEEYSAYNDLNTRNIRVRKYLRSWLAESSSYNSDYPSYHKVNKNTGYRPLDNTGLNTKAVYDNAFIQHQIPQSDAQYAWITGSLAVKPSTSGYLTDYSNLNSYNTSSFQLLSGSVSGPRIVDYVGLNTTADKHINLSSGITSTGSNYDGDLNKYLNNVNGPYGYPSWKQIRKYGNKIVEDSVKNNNILSQDIPTQKSKTENGYTLYYTENKTLTFTSYKQPAVTFNKPMKHSLFVTGSEAAIQTVSTYDNNKERFTNERLATATNIFSKEDVQAHDLFVALDDGMYSPKPELYKIEYETLLVPSDTYAGLSDVRLRDNYEDFLNNTSSIVNTRTFWRDSIDERARASITQDIYEFGDTSYNALPQKNYFTIYNDSLNNSLAIGENQNIKESIFSLDYIYSSSYQQNNDNTLSQYKEVNRIVSLSYKNDWIALSNGLDSTVYALSSGSDGLYVGGLFSSASNNGISATTVRIAKWNGSTWSSLSDGLRGISVSVIYSSSNDLYVGGQFTSAVNSGTPIETNNIAKWNGSTWSSLSKGLSNYVNAIFSGSDGLYVGGIFTSASNSGVSVTTNRIAKWNGSTWSSLSNGLNNTVYAIHSASDGLYVGGNFDATNDYLTTLYGIAKWNGSAWSSLSPTGIVGTGVRAIYSASNGLYIGGDFTNIGGISANCISFWNGSTWSSLSYGLNGRVDTIHSASDGLYVGGIFTSASNSGTSVTANYIAKWNGYTWSSVINGLNNEVKAITSDNNKIYFGGVFTKIFGKINNLNYSFKNKGNINFNSLIENIYFNKNNIFYNLKNLASYDVKNNNIYNINNNITDFFNFNGNINKLILENNNLYICGNFTEIIYNNLTSSINRVAKWNGSTWNGLSNGLNGGAIAIASGSDGLYTGGSFTSASNSGVSVTTNYIAKWSGSAWNSLSNGLNNYVNSIFSASDGLYAAGAFTSASNSGVSVTTNRIAKWNGSTWSSLSNGLSSIAYSIISGSDGLYVGGLFASASNSGVPITTNRVAKWNGSTWSSLSNGLNGFVYTLYSGSDGLYAAGAFTSASNSGVSVTTNRIAKWNGSTWSSLSNGLNGEVYAIHSASDGLYVGGQFTSGSNAGNSIVLNNIAKWDGVTWKQIGRSGVRNGFNLSSTDVIYYITGNQEKIIMCGNFSGTRSGPIIKDQRYEPIEVYYPSSKIIMPTPQLIYNNFIPPSTGAIDGMKIYEPSYNSSNILVTPVTQYSSSERINIINDGYQYEINEKSGKNPFFNSYLEYLGKVKGGTQIYSIIPEYTISDFIKTYVKEKNGNYNSILEQDYLKLGGAAQESGYEDINNSINSSNLLNPKLVFDNSKSNDNINLNLKISGIKKLIPYRDFYPSERIVKLSNYFINSFLDLDVSLTSVLNPNEIYSSSLSNGTPINQQILTLLQPVMAPGILLNTIKSSIAVDWPLFITNSVSYDSQTKPEFYAETGSNLITNQIYSPITDQYYNYTASNYIDKEQNYRLPFEAIIEFDTRIPQELRSDDKNLYYLNPTYYTSDVITGSDYGLLSFPSYNMGTGSLKSFVFRDANYKLAMHNFLAEIPNFFLNGKLTNIVSLPENEFNTAVSGVTYYMDVVLERDSGYKEFIADPYYEGLKALENSFSDGTFLLPSPDSLYGPPTRYWNNANPNPFFSRSPYNFYSKLLDTPAYAPYVPPYYYGKAIARISFTADQTKAYRLSDIHSLCKVEYINTEAQALFEQRSNFISGNFSRPFTDNYSTSPAYKQMMTLSSSVNLFLSFSDKLVSQDANTGVSRLVSGRETTNNSWVIQTKFETPSINFSNSDLSGNLGLQFLGGTKENDSVKGIYSYMMKGLWTTYGTPVDNGSGIKMYVQDSFQNILTNQTGSLIDLCGFRNAGDKKTIGLLAERKKVSECVLMIPYTFIKNHGPDKNSDYATTIDPLLGENGIYLSSQTGNGPYYYAINKRVISEYLDGLNFDDASVEQINKAAQASPYQDNTIIKLILAMIKYVIPPHLDWIRNKNINPFIMYVAEFSTEFDKQDLSDIWQGVMPKQSYTAEIEQIDINHKFTVNEFFHSKRPQNDTKFKTFKVKQRANINYYKLTDDSKDDVRFKFTFDNSQQATIPQYSYNWPYDFFSLVELVNVDANISVDNFPQTTEALKLKERGEIISQTRTNYGPLTADTAQELAGRRVKEDKKEDKVEVENVRFKPFEK